MISNARDDSAWRGLANRVVAVLLVLGISAALGVSAIAAEDPDITIAPRQLIDDAASKIVTILGRKGQSSDVRVAEIEEIAYELFDFTTMSKLVLARNWRKLDTEKRAEFVREFKRNLSRTYGTRLDRYDQEDIEIFGTQIEPRDDVSVKTRIVGGQFDGAVISYRLRERRERWRIIDVVIEGISLVSNYRSQFSEILNNGTIDDLMVKMRDKNFEMEEEK